MSQRERALLVVLKKSTEEANHTIAGSRRAAAERTPGEAVVGQAAVVLRLQSTWHKRSVGSRRAR